MEGAGRLGIGGSIRAHTREWTPRGRVRSFESCRAHGLLVFHELLCGFGAVALGVPPTAVSSPTTPSYEHRQGRVAPGCSRVTWREVVGGPVARLFNDGDRPAVAAL